MDRRNIGGTLCGILLASGIGSMIGATALPDASPYFTVLMWGGGAGVVVGFVGLLVLFLWQPKKMLAAPPPRDQTLILDGNEPPAAFFIKDVEHLEMTGNHVGGHNRAYHVEDVTKAQIKRNTSTGRRNDEPSKD
jgi:hypothetical protein